MGLADESDDADDVEWETCDVMLVELRCAVVVECVGFGILLKSADALRLGADDNMFEDDGDAGLKMR
jgi:hypothetical protein